MQTYLVREVAEAERQAHPALEGDTATDVVIVGAGITGLTAALLLKRAGRRVLVLEAHAIGARPGQLKLAGIRPLLQENAHVVKNFVLDRLPHGRQRDAEQLAPRKGRVAGGMPRLAVRHARGGHRGPVAARARARGRGAGPSADRSRQVTFAIPCPAR